MADKKQDPFYQVPQSAANKPSVLDKNKQKYSPPDEVDGEQPYYWAQGLGSLTGGTTRFFNGEEQ